MSILAGRCPWPVTRPYHLYYVCTFICGRIRTFTACAAAAAISTTLDTQAMDAMSDAIDMAEVVLYGVSLAYKESANCRLEANYAHQQEKEMIPLMMQKQYNVKGCKFF
jgi:hypothetical protein